jgi:hypothetical protein
MDHRLPVVKSATKADKPCLGEMNQVLADKGWNRVRPPVFEIGAQWTFRVDLP